MKFHVENNSIYIKVEQNLNLNTKKFIENLVPKAQRIQIDLSETRIVDSEGMICLFNLVKKGKQLTIIKPPSIMFEIINILSMQEILSEINIIQRS